MRKANIIKTFLLIFACKSTTDSIYKKRKHNEGSSKTDEDKPCKKACPTNKHNVFMGFDSLQDTNFSERFKCLDSASTTNNPLVLEDDNWSNLESGDEFCFTLFDKLQQVKTTNIKNREIQRLVEQEINLSPENIIPAVISPKNENFFDMIDADYKSQEGNISLQDELLSRLNILFDKVKSLKMLDTDNEETKRLIEETLDLDPAYSASTVVYQEKESTSGMDVLSLKSQNENIDEIIFKDAFLGNSNSTARSFQNSKVYEKEKVEKEISMAQSDAAYSAIDQGVEDTNEKIATFCELQNEDLQEMRLQDYTLERLKNLYSRFIIGKYGDKNGELLNRCLVLFPETLALLYLKVKNKKSDEYINNLLKKIFNLYIENMVTYSERLIDIYQKRINFRQEMLNILKNEMPNLGNYILLYELLSLFEKTSFNIQKLTQAKNYIFTRNITNVFNIIFFLDVNEVILLKEKIDAMLRNISFVDNFVIISNLNFEGFDLKVVLNNIIILKKMYDELLLPINTCKEKRQKLNKYYNNKLRKLQTDQYGSLNSSDIITALNGLEIYKQTFRSCNLVSSIDAQISFLNKIDAESS